MTMRTEGRRHSDLRGLYLVTPDEADDAALLVRIERALLARPALVQYRSKSLPAAARRRQALDVLRLCRAAGVPMVVNDSLDLALEIGADGVHLGRDDGDPAEARRRLGEGRILGVSCYDEWARAQAAATAGADYVAFGAMFASPTKPAAARAPAALLTRARAELSVMVAAIGGIRAENAGQLVAAGADLLAVISDIFDAADPAARGAAYRAAFEAGPPPGLPPQ